MNIPDYEFWRLIHDMKAAIDKLKETTAMVEAQHERYLKDALRASDWEPKGGWQEDYEPEAPLLHRGWLS
jgi:hypothetical protein